MIDGRFAGRLGATLYGVSGAVVLATMPLIEADLALGRLAVLAVMGVIMGPLVLLLPWERHGRLLAGVLVALGQVHLLVAEWLVPGAVAHYLPLYVLSYLYAGMTQPQRWSLLLTPLTIANFIQIGSHGTDDAVLLLVTLPVGVAAAEVVSWLVRREHEELEQVAKILAATKRLVAAESTDDATRVVGELTLDLAGADAVAVFVVDASEPSRFNVHMRSEELDPLGPISLDIEQEVTAMGTAIRSHRTVSVPDAARSDFVARRLVEAADVGSAALVPLFDRGIPVGAIALLWHRVGETLATSASQVIDLVAAEAGPILNRLRDRDRLNEEAETDPLTGLANRRTFNRALDRSETGDALVMIDLDRFKRVNDDHGHAAGDDTLRTMGACLRQAAREGDCIARFGGEEFAVLLFSADGDGVRAFLTRLRDLWVEAKPLTTFSAGYAIRGSSEGSLLTLGRADGALYDAKRHGRNTDVEANPAEPEVA